jgi:hypothetical protein
MDTSRLLMKDTSDSDLEFEDSSSGHVERTHRGRGKPGSKNVLRYDSVWFICIAAFFIIYFLGSIPFILYTSSRRNSTVAFHVPAIPYCKSLIYLTSDCVVILIIKQKHPQAMSFDTPSRKVNQLEQTTSLAHLRMHLGKLG